MRLNLFIKDFKERVFVERESFGSRLGFILISAGCAIGIGNVWRFPYVAGNNGGGIFVLLYLFFLVIMGVPVLTMEFAVGRSSRKSIMGCYQVLEKPGSKWHLHRYAALVGNYLLMFFYTVVSGWMMSYFFRFLTGKVDGSSVEKTGEAFASLLASPSEMLIWMAITVVLGFGVCSLGLQKGVEKITKVMMLALLVLIAVLAINSLTLKGGMEGLKFYLVPNASAVKDHGIINVIVAAMNQSFFTLSVGIGSMEVFGSYMEKKHSLLGESIRIALLDTFVAVMAGLIIFPACFAFGISPDSGPSLIFITLPNVFGAMAGGRIWGTLFFLFMTFASLSTVIAVFENIIACGMDGFKWSRKKSTWLNCVVVLIGSIPCALGFNVLSNIQPMGTGSSILDLEDFLVSNLLLPIGSLIFVLFCVSKKGWGFENYQKEANEGNGMKIPAWLKGYVKYVLPILVLIILILGLVL